MTINYAALDRHIEAIGRRGYIWFHAGNYFLEGGDADGVVIAGRYPPPTFVQVPIGDGWGYPFRLIRYRLKTFIWGDDGYEAWYEHEAGTAS